MSRECAFCASTDSLTGEHVWSDWAGQILGEREYRFVRRESADIVRTWRSRKLDSKANVVCERCNSGWMSELESKAKSVIRNMVIVGTPTEIASRDLVIITAWVFSKAVVADHMHENRPPFFTLAERRSFANNLALPVSTQVWLAAISGARGLFKSHYIETPKNTSRDFEIQAFTYGLGHFVVQITVSKWKHRIFRRQTQPIILQQANVWDSVSIPSWPHSGSAISWPPAKHLSEELVDIFVKRWAKLTWHA